MMRRWRGSIVLFGCGVVLGAAMLIAGNVTAGVLLFLLCTACAAVVSPRAFPRSVTDSEARADGRPIVYWRPGCPYCLRLRTSLGRDASRVHWVDIWADPEGAATVREATGGDETVPTVVFGGRAHVNPNPKQVREMVRT